MKGIIYIVIAILVAVAGYEAYQIQELKKIVQKQEPKVTINIQKDNPVHKQKNVNSQVVSNLSSDTNQSLEELQKTIQKDFQKIFRDFFGNKEIKSQINQGVHEFQNAMTQAMQEFQKQMKDFDVDGVFSELMKGLNPENFKVFVDKGDYYEFVTDIEDKNAKVDVNVKNGYIFMDITSHIEQKTDNQVIKKESKKSYVVKVPKDAVIDSLKSEYKNGKLFITIQKAKGTQSV